VRGTHDIVLGHETVTKTYRAPQRLGWPGKESSLLERSGFLQKRFSYPTESDQPRSPRSGSVQHH